MFKHAGSFAFLLIGLLLAGGIAFAEEATWKVHLEPMYIDVYGHDQHVLNIYEYDYDVTPIVVTETGINLDVDSGLAYRGGVEYRRGKWGWGIDILSFMTSHARQAYTGAAESAGTIDEVGFEIAERWYSSFGPGDLLYFNVLEDTDLAMWTADIYASRLLTESKNSAVRMQLGIRIADFDNDYRAVVGETDSAGTRLDASSNYGALHGPIVGLSGEIRRGKQILSGYIGQSLVLGDADLVNSSRDFTGSVDAPVYTDQRSFRTNRDVAIPITEIRIKWSYQLNDMVAVGAGANSSAWWDVQVPPGAVPGTGSNATLHENTIIFFGLLAGIELTF